MSTLWIASVVVMLVVALVAAIAVALSLRGRRARFANLGPSHDDVAADLANRLAEHDAGTK